MVKIAAFPLDSEGQIDLPAWVDALCEGREYLNPQPLLAACQSLVEQAPAELEFSLQLAQLVGELNMDSEAIAAALVYRPLRTQVLSQAEAVVLVGEQAAEIAAGVLSMARTSLLELSSSTLQESEEQDQVENIKRMLATMIDDVRVAVLKLAERVVALRAAKHYEPQRRSQIASEAQSVFAPLAGRLGIWQLKWEIEDLSLRYTDPQTYQQLARQLKSKRGERENQVDHMADQVRALLRSFGIEAQVFGRAKHIYSIWRKMQSKGVSLDQVYDVRAVRVVVDSLAECYAALGVIHNSWAHIPAEFDDYIANPKENGYRSIHTAVITPDESTLEVQIRTTQMHRDAELGVCAHWSYKDAEGDPLSQGHVGYREKMDWLRQVLQWHEELAGTERISTLLRHRVSQSRIFVSTPKGHVLELPHGATVLDFAYRVHTDVGHSCRGAKVDGLAAGLQTVLATGQQVQVDTQSTVAPLRDWLEPEFGFVRTDRARAKLVSYFRNLSAAQASDIGREIFTRRLTTLAEDTRASYVLDQLVTEFGCDDSDQLFSIIGSGELGLCEALVAALRCGAQQKPSLPGMATHEPDTVLALVVEGENRDGLLLDITRMVSEVGLGLSGANGRVSIPDGNAIISLQTNVKDWRQAIQLVTYLEHLDGVISVKRESA